MDKEIWKDIKGFEGRYQVSSYGRVKSIGHTDSLGRHWKTVFLKPSKHTSGYLHVNLIDKYGKRLSILLHRLVAINFIPNPNNYPQINHKDENPANNHVDNLEWCTAQYNVNYGRHTERMVLSQSRKVVQLGYNGNIVKIWDSISEADRCGYSQGCISCCCTGKYNQYKGYYWMFYNDYLKESKEAVSKQINLANKFKNHKSKKVVQLSLDNKLIKVWSSTRAPIPYGYNHSSIGRCCHGDQSKHKGYHWMFYNDYLMAINGN